LVIHPNAYQTKNRVFGVEDGSFLSRNGKTLLAAVLMDSRWIEAVILGKITVDGKDATETLFEMLRGFPFDAIMLSGVSYAGFNLIDPKKICEIFGVPVIVVCRSKPNNDAVRAALVYHFKDWEERWSIVKGLGKIYEVVSKPDAPPIYIEVIGGDFAWAKSLVRDLATCSRIPEPIRVARFIARGLSRLS